MVWPCLLATDIDMAMRHNYDDSMDEDSDGQEGRGGNDMS